MGKKGRGTSAVAKLEMASDKLQIVAQEETDRLTEDKVTRIYKVLIVFGTRPEAIKIAPIIEELKKHKRIINTIVAVTAQHRQMLDQVIELFNISVNYDLNIMKHNQDILYAFNASIIGLTKIYEKERPDLILVQGDTTTTFAGSLAAFYLKIPVGHIEAGLRTKNIYDPFPEEVNRRLTSVIADIHFAPTIKAKNNLLSEGIKSNKIYITGNTAIDALQIMLNLKPSRPDQLFNKLDKNLKIVLVTLHRRENMGSRLNAICSILKALIVQHPDIQIIFPVHYNPNIRKIVYSALCNVERIHLIDPVDYHAFVQVMGKAYIILTDSGGIQEEAPALNKPIIVLRNFTERPEGLEAGCAKLVGTEKKNVLREIKKILTNKDEYERMASAQNPYGDGKASKRIVEFIINKYFKIKIESNI